MWMESQLAPGHLLSGSRTSQWGWQTFPEHCTKAVRDRCPSQKFLSLHWSVQTPLAINEYST